jgi:fatty acid desaturase
MTQTNAKTIETQIPWVLNCVLLVIAGALAAALLWVASHTTSWVWLVLAAGSFSYVNNTLFSLLHEATHRILHPNKRINDWMGRIAAAFFPTAYTLQRAFHLTHHSNNRTALEQFDYLRPHDNKLLKLAQWYAILTGLYWAFSPLGCLIYFFSTGIFKLRLLRNHNSTIAQQTSADAYLSSVDDAPTLTIRFEILLSMLIQATLVLALDLTPVGWGCCYAAFAVNWSALQYADHAWSPLDVRDGAWNLRVNSLVRILFLNYHYHLAHHQHPKVPWIHLPKFVDAADPHPSFLRIYLEMWRGPRPFPGTHDNGAEQVRRSGLGLP